jgi:hypothetical protein
MKENIILSDFTLEEKKDLLKGLGYNSVDNYIYDENENKILDKYLDIPVDINNMLILPGSTIILDNNEYSIIRYIEEYGEI